MRSAAFILSAFACVAVSAPALAAPEAPPALRYSVEAAPRYTVGMPAAAPARSVQPAGQPVAAAAPTVQTASIAPEHVTVTGYRGYQLGAGDKVHVTVYGEPDLSGDFEISGTGRIAFPLIGDVTAAGLTAPALGEALTQRLSGRYLLNPRISVEIVTYRPFYIVGQVNRPGGYPYTDGMTAMNAIALAGGFTPRADESDVYVRHQGETREQRMAADATTEIRPGDVVRVSESGFWTVMGVLSPVTGLIGAARYGIP